MKQIKSQYIKAALQAEFIHIEPSNNIWSGISPALPTQNIVRRRRHIPLAVALSFLLLIMSSGIALAVTPYGGQMANWVSEKFGIKLVERTPQLENQLKQSGAYQFVQGMPLKDNMDKIPAGMKFPSYLPESTTGSEPSIYLLKDGAGIRWSGEDKVFVEVWYHNKAFGKGSKTITNGEPRDIQEVKIGDLSGMAFYDDNGWNLDWAMDGHQYKILTNISLEEAIKVAKSLR